MSQALGPGEGPELSRPHGVHFNGEHFCPAGYEGSTQRTGTSANINYHFAGPDAGLKNEPLSGLGP